MPRTKKPKLPWNPLPHMEEYLDEMQGQLKDADYIRKVKNTLSYFAEWSNQQGISDVDEVQRAHVVGFQSWVNGKVASGEWKRTYAHQHMVHLRGWLNWLEDVDYIDRSPWHRIKLGRLKKEPKPLHPEELERLFKEHTRRAFQMEPFYWHREEVILVLLYGWGLRLHELVSLNVVDMDVRQEFVNVINKGGTKKDLPYTDELKKSVSRYLKVRGKYAHGGSAALLVNAKGERIGEGSIRTVVTNLANSSGVEVNPHRLRDTFGTDMINADVPIERIMKMMGHTNTKQTLAYADIHSKKLYQEHDEHMTPRLKHLLTNNTPAVTPEDIP